MTAQAGDLAVQASSVQADGRIALVAEEGQVQLLTAKDSAYHAETHTSSNAVWQTMEDKGQVDETTRYASLQAGDGITVTAGQGVVAEIHSGGAPLQSAIEALAAKPETSRPGHPWTLGSSPRGARRKTRFSLNRTNLRTTSALEWRRTSSAKSRLPHGPASVPIGTSMVPSGWL